MYPKDKKTAAMMSETIREVLTDEALLEKIMENSGKKPFYWDMLTTKNGMSAIITAQMLKAMSGDTSAFTALSRFGFGEKVQMDVSDFYRTEKIDIQVVNPEAIEEGQQVITAGDAGKQAFDAIVDKLNEGEKNEERTTEPSAAGDGGLGEESNAADADGNK